MMSPNYKIFKEEAQELLKNIFPEETLYIKYELYNRGSRFTFVNSKKEEFVFSVNDRYKINRIIYTGENKKTILSINTLNKELLAFRMAIRRKEELKENGLDTSEHN
jgi:hypothetical protein